MTWKSYFNGWTLRHTANENTTDEVRCPPLYVVKMFSFTQHRTFMNYIFWIITEKLSIHSAQVLRKLWNVTPSVYVEKFALTQSSPRSMIWPRMDATFFSFQTSAALLVVSSRHCHVSVSGLTSQEGLGRNVFLQVARPRLSRGQFLLVQLACTVKTREMLKTRRWTFGCKDER